MKLPELEKPEEYVGLYIFDFGDHVGVGFTAEEVAELLESEKYKDGKVYKIHRAYPDGRLDKELVRLAVRTAPPCRAKVHLSKYSDEKYVVAFIYPAEYDEQVSSWLLDGEYRTSGAAEGGIEAVQRYYGHELQILDRHQLFGKSESISRTGQELLASVKSAIQR
ncbi:MAG: hypothetical protein AMJ75_12465 [Phycisphaerae bacterium SM1_79]|nr:MAG: hypothetical protein AMJ75_12465 [Phycisphaerae bacterium SM1_79]